MNGTLTVQVNRNQNIRITKCIIYRNSRSMSAQHHKTLLRLCSIKKTDPRGGGKGILPEKVGYIIPEICCRKHCLSKAKTTKENRGKTPFLVREAMSTTANQVTGGVKTQDQNKKPFENSSPEKGRPVSNTVQKRLEQSSIFLSSKTRPHSNKQQGKHGSPGKPRFSNVSFEK